jgi:hypothetical protein
MRAGVARTGLLWPPSADLPAAVLGLTVDEAALHTPTFGMDVETLRLAVYHGFAHDGRAPSHESLAATCGATLDEVRRGLERLASDRHLVLSGDGAVVMAHPFASLNLGFSVMGRATLWWGGCAWDSFALPHLLTDESDVLVATRCPACDAALSWVVGRHAPPAGDEVAHFLVPAAHMWDDVVRTCSNQRLFCSPDCIQEWLRRNGYEEGCVMDLTTLWRFARGWYRGRLERGYQRRDPVAATNYFKEVGLHGPFWGLPD